MHKLSLVPIGSMLLRLSLLSTVYAATNASSPVVVCAAGQCLEGFSNTTIGTTISASGAQTSALLLPGQYTQTTNPQLLHELLTSSSASLTPSAGFNSSSVSLPLTIALEPGMAIYSDSLYGGSAGFSSLPTSPVGNTSTPLTAQSLALGSNVWAILDVGSTSRVVFWDSVPDISQLAVSGSLSLVDMQSSACEPACSGNGVCTLSGTCSCAAGFTGASCESCESGFFGPTCQACPSGCLDCDQGISGTGKCLAFNITDAPSTCNCINGECGSNGECSCNAGWTTAANGTACAQCDTGFFLTSTGDCKICAIGCSACADITGECQTCKSGFTQDGNDKTLCDAEPTTTSSGTVCPDGSFGSSGSTSCSPCSSSCQTCNGPTSNNCIICASGSYAFNGSCITASSTGVCSGTGLIADNNKKECDACGAKCTSCEIPGFTTASTVSQLQCTGCLPGSFLSNGTCVASCPSGSFVSSENSTTCTTCDSSCSTCAGSSTFCLTCANGELASNGKCVSTCPANTVSSNSTKTCLDCHPDCVSCSGTSFNQCLSCPPDRPVLSQGRCLPVCGNTQFFDSTSQSCQSCDSSCSSCSGSGPSNCLACSSSSQVLQSGSCVSANCNGTSDVVTGLGVCLSDLVQVTTSTASTPLPSISGITQPTTVTTDSKRLTWWEILLMTLGCAFIFVVFLWCWRKRARKQRAKRTKAFAQAKKLDRSTNWRWRLLRFGEKFFGHHRSQRAYPDPSAPDSSVESEELKLMRMRNAEEARHHQEMEKLMLISDYQYAPDKRSSHSPSVLPSLYDVGSSRQHLDAAGPSLYSQVTGVPRNGPEIRQPVKKDLISSRFSASTLSSAGSKSRDLTGPRAPSPAEEYAMSIRHDLLVDTSTHEPSHWLQPTHTGATVSSKNPFRR